MSSIIGVDTRSTRDIDLTWKSIDYSVNEIITIINELNEVNIGIPIYFKIQRVKENIKIEGRSSYQIILKANYEKVNLNLKLDISNGTLIYPEAIEYSIKSNFSDEYIDVKSYSIENIIAEKFETILSRGEFNGRMRDYFDLYMIKEIGYEYNEKLLYETILKVAKYRGTLEAVFNALERIEIIQNSKQFILFWNEYCKLQSKARYINIKCMFEFLRYLYIGCSKYLQEMIEV